MKEIQLRRRETKNHLPVPVTSNSKKYLGSIYSGQAPLRGLNSKEEKEILAEYLGMDPEEKDFPRIAREFWADIRIEVPSDGKTLNITVENDVPVNPYDYMVYRFAKIHPHVGKNLDDMLSDSRKMFYIHDFDEAIAKTNAKVNFKKKAYGELIKIGEDEDKLNRILRLLTDSDPEYMSIKEKQNYIDQLIENDPVKFVTTATDKDLELRSTIAEMVTASVLSKIGNQYWFIDEKIGDDEDEAVKFFKDKKRSGDVLRMKAKLEEAKRNK